MRIKTGKELAVAALDAANSHKTLYVMGCWGAPMTEENKARWLREQPYNRRATRSEKISSASADTFGFDCVNLIKGLLWDWNGDAEKSYGGAGYAINGVPDINEAAMIAACSQTSTDFSDILVGEVLWLPGHIGIYVGDGLAVEATPNWDDGVQITACNRDKTGYHRRNWTKHGRLPYVTYEGTLAQDEGLRFPLLQAGCSGPCVMALQLLLIGYGFSCGGCGADGQFGEQTRQAVLKFQTARNLEVDGIAGPETMKSLLGV